MFVDTTKEILCGICERGSVLNGVYNEWHVFVVFPCDRLT